MKNISHALKIFLSLAIVFFITACGYKPSSKFARSVVGEKVSTSVIVSLQDPENTVIIKDAVDSAIIEVFHASLVDRAISDTHLVLSIGAPSYDPIIYDRNGYVVGYRMTIDLYITRQHDGVEKKYATKGTHDFTIEPNAVVTDQQRFEAIKFGAEKAIQAFLAQVSAEGARANKAK